MTRPHLRRIVAVWMRRLGLTDWDLVIDWETATAPEHDASVWRSGDYMSAKLRLNEHWRKWTADEANRYVVHELMHVAMRELSRAHDYPLGELGDEAARVAVRAWEHAEEQTVEKLAVALVGSWGPVL